MTTYRVTMVLTQKELLEFIDSGSAENYAIQPVELGESAPRPPLKGVIKPAPRRKRTSKVNETILGRLRQGDAAAVDLRSSLEEAGLSPGSLSTGLALLQKDGKIRRGADGSYALSDDVVGFSA